ncbi:MAG: DnaJ domain-containing protein [Deltaproteobacteria bacterium]|nr:DnaJ domain-containing protein [Deltaproteobacteria bacterium]
MSAAAGLTAVEQAAIEGMHARIGQTHYELLGVGTGATVEEVRHAYYELCKRFHPDVYYRRDVGAHAARLSEIFHALTTAFEALANPTRRTQYDIRIGLRPPPPVVAPGMGGAPSGTWVRGGRPGSGPQPIQPSAAMDPEAEAQRRAEAARRFQQLQPKRPSSPSVRAVQDEATPTPMAAPPPMVAPPGAGKLRGARATPGSSPRVPMVGSGGTPGTAPGVAPRPAPMTPRHPTPTAPMAPVPLAPQGSAPRANTPPGPLAPAAPRAPDAAAVAPAAAPQGTAGQGTASAPTPPSPVAPAVSDGAATTGPWAAIPAVAGPPTPGPLWENRSATPEPSVAMQSLLRARVEKAKAERGAQARGLLDQAERELAGGRGQEALGLARQAAELAPDDEAIRQRASRVERALSQSNGQTAEGSPEGASLGSASQGGASQGGASQGGASQGGASQGGGANGELERCLTYARRAEGVSNWSAAAQLWEAAAKIRDTDADLWLNAARSLLQAGERTNHAVELCRRAVTLAPERLEPNVCLAQLLLRAGLVASARAAYETARRLQPSAPAVLELAARFSR